MEIDPLGIVTFKFSKGKVFVPEDWRKIFLESERSKLDPITYEHNK